MPDILYREEIVCLVAMVEEVIRAGRHRHPTQMIAKLTEMLVNAPTMKHQEVMS